MPICYRTWTGARRQQLPGLHCAAETVSTRPSGNFPPVPSLWVRGLEKTGAGASGSAARGGRYLPFAEPDSGIGSGVSVYLETRRSWAVVREGTPHYGEQCEFVRAKITAMDVDHGPGRGTPSADHPRTPVPVFDLERSVHSPPGSPLFPTTFHPQPRIAGNGIVIVSGDP